MPTTQVYTEAEQTAILSLQRQGARLVRMKPDGKCPSHNWGGRIGRCLTQWEAESWLRKNGRFALVPFSIGFSVLDVDDGPWQALASAYPPHAVINSRRLWRRHLYYPNSEPRPNAQKRNLHGCLVDVYAQRRDTSLCGSLRPSWKPLRVRARVFSSPGGPGGRVQPGGLECLRIQCLIVRRRSSCCC